ncbi:MAG: hypothetical protein LBQ57_05915 [Spirochaetales bacterium]|jgi:hypothetical protein|nr:hypothetical protein [Spirochaetales bacterium]
MKKSKFLLDRVLHPAILIFALALTFGLVLTACGGDDPSSPGDSRTELTEGSAVSAAAAATSANVTFTGAAGLSLSAADFAVTTDGAIGTPTVVGDTVTVPVSFEANTTAAAKTYTVSIAAGSTKIRGSGTVTITQAATTLPAITWAGSFAEAAANDGSITGSVTATLVNDTFTSSAATAVTGYTATGVPAGLTLAAVKTSDTLVTFTLSGNASAHASTNSITNLAITFTNGAFTNTAVSGVTGYSKTGIAVTFVTSPGDTAVSFSNLTHDGSSTKTTTALYLTFSADITGLAAADITITGGSTGATKGALTGPGANHVYTLGVTGITQGGEITVAVAKQGYGINPASRNVTVNYYAAPVFVAVTNITGVPDAATVGQDLTLSGAVVPSTATNKTIVWTVKTAGTTAAGAAITNGNKLKATGEGIVKVIATIANGKTASTAYTQEFTVTVSADETDPLQNWTLVTDSPFASNDAIIGIAYGNGKFVAVDFFGKKIATSPDGVTWTLVSVSIFGTSWAHDIAYGNGKFVVVAEGGKIATSPDGTNWTRVENSTFGDNIIICGVAWCNDRFVAVGTSTKIATSPDGTNWTAVDFSAFGSGGSTGTINDIAFGNGTFVAVGYSGNVAISTDGVTWTAQSLATYKLNRIAWGNDTFVAVGELGRIATSPDGATWTVQFCDIFVRSGYAVMIEDIAWGNGTFVAVGESGKIGTSTDGTNWTSVSSGDSSYNNSIAYGGGRFVAVGQEGKIVYSGILE